MKTLRSSYNYLTQTFKWTLLGISLLFAFLLYHQFKWDKHFPIRKVHVFGVHKLDHEEVQSIVTPLVHRNFFTVNVEYVRDRLLQMPWAGRIFVKLHWPDRIDITVIEKEAMAKWNKESLLSENGELFSPAQNTYPPNLPQFIGPDGQQIFMQKNYQEMQRILLPLHVKITYLELTPYLTWKLKLSNGITLHMGHQDILTRLGHFVKVYPKIVADRAEDVDYIDLRYPNGLAVKHKNTMRLA